MPLLEIVNLSLSFATYLGKVHAIRNVSFSIEKGETIAIVGESGCGKSSIAQAVLGLIPQPPGIIENGEIFFKGSNLLKKSKKELRQIRGNEISMIFQDPMTSLNPTMRVGDQIMEGMIRHQGFSRKEAEVRAIEMLNMVGIGEPTKKIAFFPHELSGGMRQRVMIAIALTCKPQLLIADEPTTALDVTIQAQILDLMKEIQAKMGTSILIITHDLGIVAGMCNRVIVMYSGQIAESGYVEQIYSNPRHPYTCGLLRSAPRLDMEKHVDLIPIRGTSLTLFNPPKGCSFYPRCEHAMQICQNSHPPLKEVAQGHHTACWLEAASRFKK